MAVPYELYLRYLATCSLVELRDVNRELGKLSLRPITQEDLNRVWDLINSVLPKGILTQIERKSYGSDFLAHMKILEISDLWSSTLGSMKKVDNSIRAVLDIHEEPSLRLTINALLVKNLKIEEICRLVNAKFTTNYKEIQIELYQRYFFDAKRMNRKTWHRYLARVSAKEKEILFMALTESVDTLKTELDLPATISVSDTLQWLITKSFAKAKNYMNVGTPEADTSARLWTDQVLKLADKYEKYRSADQHDFAKTLQMEFDFIEDEFDTPDSAMLTEVASSRASSDPDTAK